jgi:N-ethylmaleimide reductase
MLPSAGTEILLKCDTCVPASVVHLILLTPTIENRHVSDIDLFTPITIGSIQLNNRMVMAPMTRARSPDNVPTELMAEYYEQRASAGLIITEGSQISPQGVGYPATPGIYTAEQVAAWRRVTDAVHAQDGKIFIQLWHVGRISHSSVQPNGAFPVAPSAVRPAGQIYTVDGLCDFETPRALERHEIPAVIQQYAAAAANALTAGFDGVELHAANGYLIDQFLRSGTNRRSDDYGGSAMNRIHFLIEVTEAVAQIWGAGQVGVRLSPASNFNDMYDEDPAEIFATAARELSRLAIGYLHVVELLGAAESFDFPALRKHFGGPYMANGGYDLDKANQAIAAGNADLVSFGVPFIANPDLPRRFRLGAPLNEPDNKTFYAGGERGFADYPFLPDDWSAAVKPHGA